AAGELGPSGHADGDGAGRVRALAAAAALRPGRPDLAEPRPLRALGGPRLDAALLAPPPDRSEVGEPRVRDPRDAGRDARRHPPLPSGRQQVSRASRVPLDLRRRDHDGPSRSGRRDQRRHGDRRALAGGALQPPDYPLFDYDISVRPSLPPALDPEVEHSVGVRLPSSSTPALSHFWIRRTTRRSAMRCSPTFCKVLVRCNPEGDAAMNRRQAGRLRHLSDYLHRTGRKFMFELLVPAEQAELEELHGDKRAYDRSRRPRHMVDAIHELQDAGVEPDVWKIEGLDRTEDCVAGGAAARRDGDDSAR